MTARDPQSKAGRRTRGAVMRPAPLLVLLSIAVSALAQLSLPRSALNSKADLIVHFPARWSVDEKASTFTIVSLAGQKRPPQVMVPLNEAQIVVTGPPEGITSVPEWLHSDRIQADRGDQVSSLEITTDHFGVVTATEVRNQPSVIPAGTIVIDYLDLDHRPVKVALVYRGEKRASYFEGVFHAVVKALSPNGPPR